MPLDEDGINRYEEPADADKSLDTSDVQWNNINSKRYTEATKIFLTWGTYLIRKALKDKK